MNAITQTQTVALETADPTKNLILVPLSQLVSRPSGRNVRKHASQSIDALAASIAHVGLLQNLTVIQSRNGEHYEVVAGGRRLAALKLLAKKRRISKTLEIPCLLVADATARTASLTENVQREAMHPADQFEAFAALVAEGRPIEDIAADFSVTPLVVQRRLKLANVSPRLMMDYRADIVTLDQLMALAITDDHAAQEAAFYDAPTWQRSPSALRERLTEREIDGYICFCFCFTIWTNPATSINHVCCAGVKKSWRLPGSTSCTFSACISLVWFSLIPGSRVNRCLSGMRLASLRICRQRSLQVVFAASMVRAFSENAAS